MYTIVQRLETFPAKLTIVNILGFVGPGVLVVTIQPCGGRVKATTDNNKTKGHDCDPVNFILENERQADFGL